MTIELNSIIAIAEHSMALYVLDAVEHSIYQTFEDAGKSVDQAYRNLQYAVKEDYVAWNART